MTLKATKPEKNVEKRLKLFLFGAESTGKTRCALQFPNTYFIDCERGTDNYMDLFEKGGSVRLQTTDVHEVVEQVKALAIEQHDYRTLVIDPITTLEADLIGSAQDQFGFGDMRIWQQRDRALRRLTNLLYAVDMNVILTAHGKTQYGEDFKKLGTTYDGWKRWIYVFDLAIELYRVGGKTKGLVRKTRVQNFPEKLDFDFSYSAIRERFGKDLVDKKSTPVVPASKDDVAKLEHLLTVVTLAAGTEERWLTKAGVDEFEDMSAEQIKKCIAFVNKKLETK